MSTVTDIARGAATATACYTAACLPISHDVLTPALEQGEGRGEQWSDCGLGDLTASGPPDGLNEVR